MFDESLSDDEFQANWNQFMDQIGVEDPVFKERVVEIITVVAKSIDNFNESPPKGKKSNNAHVLTALSCLVYVSHAQADNPVSESLDKLVANSMSPMLAAVNNRHQESKETEDGSSDFAFRNN